MIGDFGVVATNDFVGRVIRWGTESAVNHAFVDVGDGQLLEAEPGGARLRPVDEYGDAAIWSTGLFDLSDLTRRRIASFGRGLVGTPYGWPDIAAIALAQRRAGRLLNSDDWIAKRLCNTRRLMCSQLVDFAYHMGGVELFTDGRLFGLVSPGDLLNLITARKAAAA